MKKIVLSMVVAAVVLWLVFAAVLLGRFAGVLPEGFTLLALPKTTADFGQSFSAFDGLLSSLALVLGLSAILIQVRQQADSNVIGAYGARQQFLLADCDRLEAEIQRLKTQGIYDATLFKNMVEKKKRQMDECKRIDDSLTKLLARI